MHHTGEDGPASLVADKGNQFISNVMAWNGLGLALFDGTCHQNRPDLDLPTRLLPDYPSKIIVDSSVINLTHREFV
jgi:hypothetical protein